jgi:uncharacterized protein
MSTSLYAMTVPAFVRMFDNMLDWLDRAETHAKDRKFDSTQFLSTKLAPDMLPFSRQIQIATDSAKGCVCRLAGVELPSWPDNEATFDELRARVKTAKDFVSTFSAASIDAAASREITVPMRNRDPLKFTAEKFVCHWALPNFYFHATTAYALLRHGGVALGKSDFLGPTN